MDVTFKTVMTEEEASANFAAMKNRYEKNNVPMKMNLCTLNNILKANILYSAVVRWR